MFYQLEFTSFTMSGCGIFSIKIVCFRNLFYNQTNKRS